MGSRGLEHTRTQERRLVRFLDDIKDKAGAVYMLGDMFDFWYEYRMVVPKGFTRFLGKVSELTDNGVEVHYFIGNHDLWAKDYLEKECGVVIHREPHTIEIGDKVFFLAHGDGLGDPDPVFRFLRGVFRNRVCQFLFSALHPRWGMDFGLNWARHSMLKHKSNGVERYKGEDKEFQVLYAKQYLKIHPEVNFFMFGHRHIELDLMLSRTARVMILGDWMHTFTYAVYDGVNMFMENYIEGETEL